MEGHVRQIAERPPRARAIPADRLSSAAKGETCRYRRPRSCPRARLSCLSDTRRTLASLV